MLKNVKIINKTEAAKVTLFISGEPKPLTADQLTDEEARLIMAQYADSYGLFFEEKVTAKAAKVTAPKPE